MQLVSVLAVILVVVAAFWFMLRPLLQGLLGGGKAGAHKTAAWQAEAHEIALEVAVLTSLLVNFPYGIFGMSAIVAVIALALGLAFVPGVARLAIAALMLVLSVTRLNPDTLSRLLVVLAAFVLLRIVWRLARHVG